MILKKIKEKTPRDEANPSSPSDKLKEFMIKIITRNVKINEKLSDNSYKLKIP